MAKRYGKSRMRKRTRSRRSRKYRTSYKTTPLVKKNRMFAHKCTDVIEVKVGNPAA